MWSRSAAPAVAAALAVGCQDAELPAIVIDPPVPRGQACPLRSEDPLSVVSLGSNDATMVALLSNGQALCWGYDDGVCGRFDQTPQAAGGPMGRVIAAPCLQYIAVGGGRMSAGIDLAGEVLVWGPEVLGEAGDGAGTGPGLGRAARLELPERIVALSVESAHMLALSAEGRVYLWGTINWPDVVITWDVPGLYPTPEPVVQLEAGNPVSCLLYGSGSVACFGANRHPATLSQQGGFLGLGLDVWGSFEPVPIPLPGPAKKVEVTDGGTACALLEVGEVWCWGDNNGLIHLPIEELPFTAEPSKILGLPLAVELHVEAGAACVLGEDHRATCWGWFGSLQAEAKLPEPWHPELEIVELAVAEETVCALTTSGVLHCDGGISGDPSVFDRDVDLEAALGTTLGIAGCKALSAAPLGSMFSAEINCVNDFHQ